jgi:hypothetical protein
MSGRRTVVKIIAKSLSHDEKHVVPTPLSGIRVGERRSVVNSIDSMVYKRLKMTFQLRSIDFYSSNLMDSDKALTRLAD